MDNLKFDQKVLETNKDVSISYFDIGQGKNVLLFIHGWLASKESWIPVINHIIESEKDLRTYRILCVDMLGHGNSTRSLKLSYSTEEQVGVLLKLILSLSLKNITLIGHSNGGKISLFLANKLKNISHSIAKKVILLNSIGNYESWLTLHILLKISLWVPIRNLIGIFTLPLFIDLYFKKFLFLLPISEHTKKNIANYLSDYVKVHFESLRNKIVALRITKSIFDKFVENINRRDLPEVEIVGSSSDMLVSHLAQQKFSIMFDKPIHILKDAGHMTPLEVPEALASLIKKLIK